MHHNNCAAYPLRQIEYESTGGHLYYALSCPPPEKAFFDVFSGHVVMAVSAPIYLQYGAHQLYICHTLHVSDACRFSLSLLPTILLTSTQFLISPLMSHTHPTSTSSNFQLIFNDALKAYKKRTKNDLLTHPLADRLESCDSASSILTVLQEQVQELNESQRSNTKWLVPTVNVLHAFSETLGEGVGSVCFRT